MKTTKSLLGILTITAALVMQVHAQDWLTNGLVLYYPFNGNANDTSGHGNNGAVNGATLTADRYGNPNGAYYFNGASSDILVPETLFGPTEAAWTVSLWITFDSGPYSDLTTVYEKSCVNGEMSLVTCTNHVFVQIHSPSQGWIYAGVPVLTNSTMHVVGVYRKGQSISLYIDGVLRKSVPVPNEDLFVRALPLSSALGAYHNGGSPYCWFRGTLDDFRVYTRALSAPEVQQLYAYESVRSCVSPPAGLTSWWPGEGSAKDITGNNNGMLLNGVTFAPGKVGQAFSFDGTDDYIRVADSHQLHFTNALTIETWVYPTSIGGVYREVVSKWGWINEPKSFTTALDPSGQIGIGACFNGDCSAFVGAPSTSSIPVNQWTHFAATYDGSALRCYVNGVCENQQPYTGNIFANTSDLLIGGAAGPGGGIISPFAGRIDEPGVYNRALSAAEIQAIYNAGSLGKCRPLVITTQPRSQVGYWGKSATFNVAAYGSAPLSYQWFKEGTPLAGATGSSLLLTNLQAADAGNYSVVITDGSGSITSSSAYLTVNPAGVSLALYSGITIDGVVGLTYGIQYSTNLSNTNGWQGLANVTLSVPTMLWFDMQPANQPHRYYRVVPGPITIP